MNNTVNWDGNGHATDWLLEEMLLRNKEQTTLNIFLKYFEYEF
jgi:hypothetical protein